MAYYITAKQKPKVFAPTLQDFLLEEVAWSDVMQPTNISATVTRAVDEINESVRVRTNISGMIAVLKEFNQNYKRLIEADKQKLYTEFYIPKKTGGLRRIDAPCEELMDAQRRLKSILEDDCGALYHNAAFAYVRKRCTVDAIKVHQKNNSKWFYKSDFSDFFGKTTPEFLMNMLAKIFPFCEIIRNEEGKAALETALSVCFLNGGLPQGTPISPMITNLMMIPIDHQITKDLRKLGYIYTRYADDIQISNRLAFSPEDISNYLRRVLKEFDAPYELKSKKTRYGSSSGRNWNLGVMLNANNDITVGYKEKKRFHAMLMNYLKDHQRGIIWDSHDLSVVLGKFSYYLMIEEQYFKGLVAHLNEKNNVNIIEMIKNDYQKSGRSMV